MESEGAAGNDGGTGEKVLSSELGLIWLKKDVHLFPPAFRVVIMVRTKVPADALNSINKSEANARFLLGFAAPKSPSSF